tara:strand:- start:206 stop:1225 length:1020 start_codon:yes stop_codon:yes gene_type:complete
MSKAAELAALIGSQTALSNRNLIINGAMQVAQRGTSATSQHTSGYITCDRFNVNFVDEDELRLTVTQESDGPSGFSKSLKLQTTTAESAVAAGEELRVLYRFEGQDLQSLGFGTSAAKKFTVSFYVKSSVAATYGFNAYIYDANIVFGQSYTINSANTWERKTITFDANTSDIITNDNTSGLQLNWFLMAGSNSTSGSNSGWETFATAKQAVGHTANAVATTTNATWQITGVQMEVGEQATPFEHRSFGDELRRCQRYFFKGEGDPSNDRYYGTRYSTENGFVFIDFPVTMRAIATMGYTSRVTGSGFDNSSYNSVDRMAVYMTSTVPYITFPTADAEL